MKNLSLLVLVALLGLCSAYKLKVQYKVDSSSPTWSTYFDQCDIEVPLFDSEDDCEERGLTYYVETEEQSTIQFYTSYSHETDDEEESYRLAAYIFPRDEDCETEYTGLFEEAEVWRVTIEEEECMQGRTPFDCEFYLDTQMEDGGYIYEGFAEAECDTNGVYFEGEFEKCDLQGNCGDEPDLLRPIYLYLELAWNLPFEMLDREQACVCHFCQADGDPIFPEDCAENCADYCDIADLCDDSCELNIRFRDGICDGLNPEEPDWEDQCTKRRENGSMDVNLRSAQMVQKHNTHSARIAKAAKKAAKVAAKSL